MATTQMALYILIIDDSPTIRAILEMTAQIAGYAARGFPDGYAALRWLASSDGRIPALIFLDLTMPRMDGLTTLRHLKGKPALAVVPVIVLTCREGRIDQLKARLAGADEYLTKPFTQEQIIVILHQYLDVPVQGAPSSTHDSLILQQQGEHV